jgi:hypothetical protein
MDVFVELQKWYENQCDGDWEHQYGIEIGTLDNPGWSVSIDLTDTDLEEKEFQKISNVEPERDWILCRIEEGKFRGDGGPQMLEEIIKVFLDWMKAVS